MQSKLFVLSPSSVTIQAPIHHDSSRFETDGKIGLHRDASGWKKKKFQHQYDVSRCSYGVCTIHLRIHYDSRRQRYDSPRWSYECSRMLTMPPRFDTLTAKIRNRYNQVPHLTQNTNGKETNSQLDATNESQEVSLFPVGDHKAHINRRA